MNLISSSLLILERISNVIDSTETIKEILEYLNFILSLSQTCQKQFVKTRPTACPARSFKIFELLSAVTVVILIHMKNMSNDKLRRR